MLIPLSFDVAPHKELVVFGNVSDTMDCRFRDARMEKRLSIVLSHLLGRNLRPSNPNSGRRISSSWKHIMVVVSEFGDWASSLDLDIPPEFPRSSTPSKAPEQRNDNEPRQQAAAAQDDVLTGLTEEVKVIIEATKLARAEGISDIKTLKQLIEGVAERRLPYSLPEAALDQFAIAIRPDEIAFKDPRSRKRPHGSKPKKPESRVQS
jgi:hypothetical protein